MARILNDSELRRLVEAGVVDGGIESSIRPNSYILRLGKHGEFLNTNKEFELGKGKRGIKIPPGHSVGVTALETIDFRRDAVHALYPEEDLHGILSPTTDLSREGIVAPTTQIDAGYCGTLNWTLANTSSQECRFLLGERLYRLTVFRLEAGETPSDVYTGYYQQQTGYVRSERTGPPAGMKATEWENAFVAGGPEDLLDNLIKSGYPWNILGRELKEIDQQLETVSKEYSDIRDLIQELQADVAKIRRQQERTPETVKNVLEEIAPALQNRWMLGIGYIVGASIGLGVAILTSERAFAFIREFGVLIGLGIVGICLFGSFFVFKQKK